MFALSGSSDRVEAWQCGTIEKSFKIYDIDAAASLEQLLCPDIRVYIRFSGLHLNRKHFSLHSVADHRLYRQVLYGYDSLFEDPFLMTHRQLRISF